MSIEPLAVLEDVGKNYRADGRGQVVLDGVSLAIGQAEMVAATGPSGCGKTTLLNLLGALDTADSGTVRSCGVDLRAASPARLSAYRAHSVGFVFQFYNLLPTLTALENVVAGLAVAGFGRAESGELARRMLSRVGLADAAGKFPAQLSGGEQQRVAIARALAKAPLLVLADEPTGNLDEDSSGQVMELLQALQQDTGVSVVLVTHNPAISAVADRVVRLDHGHLLAAAPTSQPARAR